MRHMFDSQYLPKRTVFNLFLYQTFLIIFIGTIITLTMNTEEDFIGKQHNELSFNSFLENLYFSAVTLSTVGFGDISPVSIKAKLFTTLLTIVTVVSFISV